MSQEPDGNVGPNFRRGDPEAVRAVRERVRRIVGFRGYRMTATDRQDVEQEVMTQIWQAANRAGFDAGNRFWGFVEVVTARRCIDWLRKKRFEQTEESDIADLRPGPQESTLRREEHRLAQTALAQLRKPCRDLIDQHVGEGKSYRQLAELLGKSEGALRVQMFRCIQEARKILDRLVEEGVAGEPMARG